MSPLQDSSSCIPQRIQGIRGTEWTCGRGEALATLVSHRPELQRRRRRCDQLAPHRHTSHLTLVQIIFIVLFALCVTSEAATNRGQFLRKSEFAQLARRGEILVDRRPAPRVDRHLYLRQGGDLFDSSSASSSRSSQTMSGQTTRPAATSSTSVVQSTLVAPPSSSNSPSPSSSLMTAPSSATGSPLPEPFDTSLGSNFTSTNCPKFFNSFLNNATFTSCLPFSLLLQNSNSFFMAAHSVTRTTQILDATCNVVFPTCNSLMGSLAQQIRDDDNCGQDYENENPLVLQAYKGLLSYGPMYQASCLKDSSGNYCFANAITNTSSPTDSYVYYLPLGMPLPGGARPTCSSCLQNTMTIFNEAASNLSQPVSPFYTGAAEQIDLGCGPSFVNTTVAPIIGSASSGASSHFTTPSLGCLVAVLVAALLHLF